MIPGYNSLRRWATTRGEEQIARDDATRSLLLAERCRESLDRERQARGVLGSNERHKESLTPEEREIRHREAMRVRMQLARAAKRAAAPRCVCGCGRALRSYNRSGRSSFCETVGANGRVKAVRRYCGCGRWLRGGGRTLCARCAEGRA